MKVTAGAIGSGGAVATQRLNSAGAASCSIRGLLEETGRNDIEIAD
jgi:hypothetical protein